VGVELVGSILLGADDLVAELIASHLPYMRGKSFGQYVALGVIRNECLVGGVVYHNYIGHDCQVSIAVERVSFWPWRALFDYPFGQLGCARITAVVGKRNKRSRRLVMALGFKLEGVHRKGLDGSEDAMSYGMLKEECRWIKGNPHGKIIAPSARSA
jgi:hypothetical protein